MALAEKRQGGAKANVAVKRRLNRDNPAQSRLRDCARLVPDAPHYARVRPRKELNGRRGGRPRDDGADRIPPIVTRSAAEWAGWPVVVVLDVLPVNHLDLPRPVEAVGEVDRMDTD